VQADISGLILRTNRAQFTEVSLRTIDEDEVLRSAAAHAILPTLQGEQGDDVELPTELTADDEEPLHVLQDLASESQLESSLVTLSLMPRHKWQTLINLETITARNKPKEAPKAPESAPFFLPTLPGTETRFDLASTLENDRKKMGENGQNKEDTKNRRLGYQDFEIDSELVSMLKKGSASDACE
jgi:U3 small nucleolar RNA-associated protein 21